MFLHKLKLTLITLYYFLKIDATFLQWAIIIYQLISNGYLHDYYLVTNRLSTWFNLRKLHGVSRVVF